MIRSVCGTRRRAASWCLKAVHSLLMLAALLSLLAGSSKPAHAETDLVPDILVGSGPNGVAVNPVTNRIYVTNRNSDNITVIDGATNAVIATVPVGDFPYGVAVNASTNRIYVTNDNDNTVTVIDGTTNTVIGGPIPVGTDPVGVAVNATTNRIYVANNLTNNVSVIDGQSQSVIATVGTGANGPVGVAVNAATNRIYVGNYDSGSVSVIDGATNLLVGAPIATGADPYDIAVNPETNLVYVAMLSAGTVVVIDGSNGAVVGAPIAIGFGVRGIAVNPMTNRIYAPNIATDTLQVIDGTTNTIIGSPIPLGSGATGVAVNPTTNRVYAVNNGNDDVRVIGIPFSVLNAPVAPGTDAAVTWNSLFAPASGDFVGLYQPGTSNVSPLSGRYTNGTASPGGTGATAGAIDVPVPDGLTGGSYELRLISGKSGGVFARASVTVAASPVVVNDAYSVNAGSTLTVPAAGVLLNDTDADSPALQATVVTGPTRGTLNLQTTGAFTYTPDASFSGTDSFTYRATDQTGLFSTATATITVTKIACGPRPSVQVQSSVANGALQVTVTATDVNGPTGNELRQLQFAAPTNARIVLDGQSHTQAFTHTVPSGAARVSFSVQRVTSGQATTVPLTVVDACGSWPTFVGGGAAAGF